MLQRIINATNIATNGEYYAPVNDKFAPASFIGYYICAVFYSLYFTFHIVNGVIQVYLTLPVIIEQCRNLRLFGMSNDGRPKRNPETGNLGIISRYFQRVWYPENWELILNNIRQMRRSSDAPVDNMGCHCCVDENSSETDKRYQTLIALMLSSQTKDQVTYAAMQRLREHGLTVVNILNTSLEQLGAIITPVSFWKTKAKFIKDTTEILQQQYNGDIPRDIASLCKLPGVGPKMAHLCMLVGWGEVTGIGVDTHVHRIANRLKWVKSGTNTAEATRIELESWLPRPLWGEINQLLVGFGQQVCKASAPSCATCLNSTLCPSSELF